MKFFRQQQFQRVIFGEIVAHKFLSVFCSHYEVSGEKRNVCLPALNDKMIHRQKFIKDQSAAAVMLHRWT